MELEQLLESCFAGSAASDADAPPRAAAAAGPASPARPAPPPDDLRDAVLHGDLLRVILGFVGAVPSLGAVCREFDAAEQGNVRHASRALLAARLGATAAAAAAASPAAAAAASPAPAPAAARSLAGGAAPAASASSPPPPSASARLPALRLAAAIEAALHGACGARAGPGAYNTQLRALLLNLSSNADLRARVLDGRLPPAQLARLPPSALASAEQVSRTAALLEAAAAAGRRAPPRADVTGLYACEACGSARQTVRRTVRMGGDVTKYTEFWTCTDCGAAVTRALPLFELGSAAGPARATRLLAAPAPRKRRTV